MVPRLSFKVRAKGTIDPSPFRLEAHDYFSTTINRIVILSSTVSVSNAPNPGKVYTEEDWNDDAISAVQIHGKGASGSEKYSASKTLAEKGKYNKFGGWCLTFR